MKYHLSVQNVSKATEIPDRFSLQRWVDEALTGRVQQAEICIRIVDESESQQLNNQYRQKNKPTNVLSFPLHLPQEVAADTSYLGDIVICAPVVTAEASEQHKPLMMHWAHMVIHGVLHLLGYDHIRDADAEVMEHIEVQILEKLGFADPYETKDDK